MARQLRERTRVIVTWQQILLADASVVRRTLNWWASEDRQILGQMLLWVSSVMLVVADLACRTPLADWSTLRIDCNWANPGVLDGVS